MSIFLNPGAKSSPVKLLGDDETPPAPMTPFLFSVQNSLAPHEHVGLSHLVRQGAYGPDAAWMLESLRSYDYKVISVTCLQISKSFNVCLVNLNTATMTYYPSV